MLTRGRAFIKVWALIWGNTIWQTALINFTTTSSPGCFSMALPHLQSQGKEPWGQGCFTTIPFTYSHPTFTWMKYVDFYSLKIESTDKVNPSEIASFFFLPSETGPFPPYPSEIFQESSPRGRRVGMLSFPSFPQPCTPGRGCHPYRGGGCGGLNIKLITSGRTKSSKPLP